MLRRNWIRRPSSGSSAVSIIVSRKKFVRSTLSQNIMYDWDSSNVRGRLSFLTSGRRMVFIIAKSQQRPVENWLAGMSSRPSDSGERSDAEKWWVISVCASRSISSSVTGLRVTAFCAKRFCGLASKSATDSLSRSSDTDSSPCARRG